MEKKKNVLLLSSLLVALVTIVAGISYAIWVYSAVQEGENVINSDCFELSFEGNDAIYLNNTFPISNGDSIDLEPYTFKIKNVCFNAIDVDVNIEALNGSTLNDTYLNYSIDNINYLNLGDITSNSTTTVNNAISSKTIDHIVLLGGEEKTYNLRLWIKESATTSQVANVTYSAKVSAVAKLKKDGIINVTLDANGGELLSSRYQTVLGRKYTNLPTPTKDGYEFNGWYSDDEFNNRVDENTSVDVSITTLYARWIDSPNE